MGGGSVSSRDIDRHYESRGYYGASSYRSDSGVVRSSAPRITNATQVFKATRMIDEFNPAVMKLPREALDSALSPHSRGIIFAEDVTGSMDRYLLSLIQTQFPQLIKQIGKHVSFNPHIMFMGVGDVEAGDRAPLQVTQFETDLRMLEQLEKIWLEKRGGGNSYESYILAWYFAAKYCKMDCFEKRGEKGFLFTFGDESLTPYISARDLKTVFGDRPDLDTREVTAQDCYDMASEKFNCYHIILHGNGYGRCYMNDWYELMGGNVCDLDDYDCLPQLVLAIIDMYEGKSKNEVISAIDDYHTRTVVKNALRGHADYVVDKKVDATDREENIEVF